VPPARLSAARLIAELLPKGSGRSGEKTSSDRTLFGENAAGMTRSVNVRPMRLLRIPEPFDHPEFISGGRLTALYGVTHRSRLVVT